MILEKNNNNVLIYHHRCLLATETKLVSGFAADGLTQPNSPIVM